jgi:hypothetical protein
MAADPWVGTIAAVRSEGETDGPGRARPGPAGGELVVTDFVLVRVAPAEAVRALDTADALLA